MDRGAGACSLLVVATLCCATGQRAPEIVGVSLESCEVRSRLDLVLCYEGVLRITTSGALDGSAVLDFTPLDGGGTPQCTGGKVEGQVYTCDVTFPDGYHLYEVRVVVGGLSPVASHNFATLRGRGLVALTGTVAFSPAPSGVYENDVVVGISHPDPTTRSEGFSIRVNITRARDDGSVVDERAITYRTPFALSALHSVQTTMATVRAQVFFSSVAVGSVDSAVYMLREVTLPPPPAFAAPVECATTDWGICSELCGGGERNRTVRWMGEEGVCHEGIETERCNEVPCTCTKVDDCKGGRLCVEGICKECEWSSTSPVPICRMVQDLWRGRLLAGLVYTLIAASLLYCILSYHPCGILLGLTEVQLLIVVLKAPCSPVDMAAAATEIEWMAFLGNNVAGSDTSRMVGFVVVLGGVAVVYSVVVGILSCQHYRQHGSVIPALAVARYPAGLIVATTFFIVPLSHNATRSITQPGASLSTVLWSSLVLGLTTILSMSLILYFFRSVFRAVNLPTLRRGFTLPRKDINDTEEPSGANGDTTQYNVRYTNDANHIEEFYHEVVHAGCVRRVTKGEGSTTKLYFLTALPRHFWSSRATSDPTFTHRYGPLFTSFTSSCPQFAFFLVLRLSLVGVLLGIYPEEEKGDNVDSTAPVRKQCPIVFAVVALVHIAYIVISFREAAWASRVSSYYNVGSCATHVALSVLLATHPSSSQATQLKLSEAAQYIIIAVVSYMLFLTLWCIAVWLMARLYYAKSQKEVHLTREFAYMQKQKQLEKDEQHKAHPSHRGKREKAKEAMPPPRNPLLDLDKFLGTQHGNQRVVYKTADEEPMTCITTLHPDTKLADLEAAEEAEAQAATRLRRQLDCNDIIILDTSTLQREADLPLVGTDVEVLHSAGTRHRKLIGLTGTVIGYDVSTTVTAVLVDFGHPLGRRRILPEHLRLSDMTTAMEE